MSKAHSRSWIQTVQDWLPSWPKRKTDPNQTVSDGEVHFNKIPLRHRRPTSALTAPPTYRDTKGNKNYCNNAVGLDSDEEIYDSHDEIEGVYQSTPVVENKPQRVIRTAQNEPKAIHDTCKHGARQTLRPQARPWVPWNHSTEPMHKKNVKGDQYNYGDCPKSASVQLYPDRVKIDTRQVNTIKITESLLSETSTKSILILVELLGKETLRSLMGRP